MIVQSYKRKGGVTFLRQRFACFSRQELSAFTLAGKETSLWFHGASVGEVKAVFPLIIRIAQKFSGRSLVLTVNTPEAYVLAKAEWAKQENVGALHVLYCPLDTRRAMRGLLDRLRPQALVVVETEIWPNLYRECHRREIPVAIVNARVSEKTMNAPAWIRKLYAEVLPDVALVLAKSQEDARRFFGLGARIDNIKVIGNIKFAATNEALKGGVEALEGRSYILGVSTHDTEELALANMFLWLAYDEVLVIVPRHPARSQDIAASIRSLGIPLAVRSRGEAPVAGPSIYLADTVGEVSQFISGADVVFVGGSLVPVGGHNVLEPAIYGKAIVSGPRLHNFVAEKDLLLSHSALRIAEDEPDLCRVFDELLGDEELRRTLGNNALEAMASCGNILDQYEEALVALIDDEKIP